MMLMMPMSSHNNYILLHIYAIIDDNSYELKQIGLKSKIFYFKCFHLSIKEVFSSRTHILFMMMLKIRSVY